MKPLFSCKVQGHEEGEHRCSALIVACTDGKQKIVDELIQAGADLNAADKVL